LNITDGTYSCVTGINAPGDVVTIPNLVKVKSYDLDTLTKTVADMLPDSMVSSSGFSLLYVLIIVIITIVISSVVTYVIVHKKK
jgi:hypothetical protein